MNDLPHARTFGAADLFANGGETGRLMRDHPWASTLLGPHDGWPAELRTLVGVMMSSGQPMFVTWGPERTLLYNDGYAAILGPRHPGALGRPFNEVWPEIWSDLASLFDSVDAGGAIHMDDITLVLERHGYPEETHFAFSYTPVRDASGRVAGMFCPCTETTAQVMAGRRLRESEEENRAIVEGALDHAIFATDPDGVIRSWSPGAEAIFGWTPQEAVGRGADIIFTPEDRAADAPAQELSGAARHGCAPDERWHVRKDGSRVFMNGSVRPLHGADGALTGFLKVARDETERRAVFDALAQSEARARALAEEQTRLAAILRQTPDFVGVTDAEGRPVYVNEAGMRMLGLPDLEAVRRTALRDYHAPAEGERLMSEVVPAVLREGIWEGELLFRRFDDGREIPVYGRLFAVRDEAGALTGTASILSDVTERKKAEAALRADAARHEALLSTQRAVQTAGGDLQAVLAAVVKGALAAAPNAEGAVIEMIEGDSLRYLATAGAAEPHQGTVIKARGSMSGRSIAEGRPMLCVDCDADERANREACRRVGIRSMVVAPIPRGGEFIGVLKMSAAEPAAFTENDVLTAQLLVGAIAAGLSTVAEAEAIRALRESERRFRDIADSIDQMIWSTLPDGFHDYYNHRWYEFTGVPEGSTDGEAWAGMFHPDDQPVAWERWSRSLRTGEPYHVEYRLRRHDGQWRWVLGRALPVRDEGGRIMRWYGTCTDIHEQKMVEARLSSIMDALPVGVLMAEAPSGQVVEANRYLETLLRRPVRLGEDATDYGGREAYAADGRRLEPEEWPSRRVLATGEPAEAEVRLRRGDGTFGWLRIQAAPVRDASGDTVGAVAGITDFEDIVAAREVVARSRAELEQHAEQLAAERDRMWRVSRELMLVAGFDGRIDAVNPAWTDQLGWTPAELVGRSFLDLVHPDDLQSTAAEAAALGEGRPTPRFENRYRTKDGEYRWLSWTAVPEAGRIFATARDVDAERRQADALERVQDQLRQAQKMEAVGQLTGGVAHDFNNLLQIVVGNLELLGRSLPADAARQRRSVDNAMSGAKRAVTLTQRLLAFSRRQPLDPKPVSVNKLVAGMSELLSRALGETIELETVLAAGLWKIEVDSNQLENAILNLAVNARDAMPEGGKLTIETANTRLDESYVQQNVEVSPGQYVVICVSDTGTGMDKEVASRVFEPFFTTKEVGRGTGLGLSQVYGFVKQSGGHVKIYSERGSEESRGTTVKIYLPRYLGPGEEEAEADEPQAPEGGPEETILVVEDDPDVRAYTVEVLSELGYRVIEAGDAHAALKLLRDGAAHCDLLFTDVVLPGGMNGEQLAAEAHVARPGLKVLFTTGYARNAIVHQGRLDPGVRLITKPFTYADLAARIRDVLDEPPALQGGA